MRGAKMEGTQWKIQIEGLEREVQNRRYNTDGT